MKEQLKKIGGMEFYDVHFSYVDLEDMQERFISVPEQGGGGLIPEGRLNAGVLHTIAMGEGGMPGVHLVELQNAGTPEALTPASFIVLCSAAFGKPVQSQMMVMGDMSLGGTITQARNLAESLQVVQ